MWCVCVCVCVCVRAHAHVCVCVGGDAFSVFCMCGWVGIALVCCLVWGWGCMVTLITCSKLVT